MMTEFGFIEALKGLCRQLPENGFEGIGDDCAVLPIGGEEVVVLTADLVVERIHFLREAYTPEQVARKALQVNLSDVASMGVRPVATLLSIALPHQVMQSEWSERFIRAYAEESERYGVALIGGDTTASKEDIVINVTALGRGPEGNLKRRSEARVGDVIYVGRPLGGSAAGLREILEGREESPAATYHKEPRAQIEEGVWLGHRREVHAMMDLSDGIASDLRHILRASGVGAEVEVAKVPLHPEASLEEALTGGEEYALLLTADQALAQALEEAYFEHFGAPLYPIGKIVAGSEREIAWIENGEKIEASWQGFTHF